MEGPVSYQLASFVEYEAFQCSFADTLIVLRFNLRDDSSITSSDFEQKGPTTLPKSSSIIFDRPTLLNNKIK